MRSIFFMFLISCFIACKTNDRNPQLIGQWQGVEWLIGDQASGLDARQVRFEFTVEGQYSAQFDQQRQSGAWRTDGEKLYTTETGKKEIVVRILNLNDQSFSMEMNRGGQKETLKLRRITAE